jgi:hypothetical protein
VSAPKDGRILESGTITAGKIALGLGLGGPDALKKPPPDDAPRVLSPAQARAAAEGKPVPKDPPGFERTIVKGGRDVAEYFGVPLGVPLGEGAEGMPLEPEILSREDEERLCELRGQTPQRTNWQKVDDAQARRKLRDKIAAMERKIFGGGR